MHYQSDKDVAFKQLPFPNGEERLYFEDFKILVEELLEEDDETILGVVNGTSKIFQQYMFVYHVAVLYIYFKFIR